MNKYSIGAVVLISFSAVLSLCGQRNETEINRTETVFRANSRAVLVDVIVTDSSGKPVTGLARDAFTVTEQGKPQTISFFEENGIVAPSQPAEMPELPPDVFTNFSPFPQPPAVNVLLFDSLNARMEDQSYVRSQAMKFLMSAKPGTRSAIFTMGLGLHFIQGFNHDPAVLAAALNNKKNNSVETPMTIKSQAETNAEAMVPSMAEFFAEIEISRSIDREFRTLANLQRLAAFLQGFPGRKNIIWFTEKAPGVFLSGGATGNPALDDELKKTIAMLGTVRAALYPVDARGTSNYAMYTAENNPKAGLSTDGKANREEGMDRNTDQLNAQILAEESGGRAFANMNGLSEILDKVTSESGHFYTLSYAPANTKMDGNFRKIDVKVAGGKYHLSCRRGYFAVDTKLPGSASSVSNEKGKNPAAPTRAAVDPLLPFMDLGMPQSQQILYKLLVVPAAAAQNEPAETKDKNHYKIDFAINLKDLKLDLGADGQHKGALNFSLIVYDRYGNIITRQDHLAALNIKPDAYTAFQQTGVQLHAEVAVPKGKYWLRTGVYDQGSHKVGTMEVAMSSVVPLHPSTHTKKQMENEKPLPPVPPADDLPARTAEKITVEQLENALAGGHAKRDKDLAKQLSGMELTERLTSPKLAKIQAALPGEKSRLALLALADASAFLQLPASEIPAIAPPDAATQKLILTRAIEGLQDSVRKLPDFLARKTTTRYHDLKVSYVTEEPIICEHKAFQFLDTFSNPVYYRNGKEVEETNEKHPKIKTSLEDGTVNWGVFGPLAHIALTDISRGKLEWSHWEQGASGPLAVFRYAIPKEKSNYTVKYCCLGRPYPVSRPYESTPPFHGEIAIDPATGAVYRLVLITEMSPTDPIVQAQTVVDYEPVGIGGKTYICPRKSVSITTAISEILRQRCWGAVGWTSDCTPQETFKPKDTAINDTTYDSYHVFRSEIRILPAESADKQDLPPPPAPSRP